MNTKFIYLVVLFFPTIFFAQNFPSPPSMNQMSQMSQMQNQEFQHQQIFYLSVTFKNEEQSKCETGTFPVKKLMAMMIVKNGLVENGQLNNDNVHRFCEERGFYFSSNYFLADKELSWKDIFKTKNT